MLLSEGFEGASFGASGWSQDVAGSGSAATLESGVVSSGAQAARFVTTTQAQGERAFVEHGVSWPSSQVETAQVLLRMDNPALQYWSKVVALETHGPHAWSPRMAFSVGQWTWIATYTTRDGVVHQDDTGVGYPVGQWMTLGLTVDYRGAAVVLTWQVNGQPLYTITDSSQGGNTDRPVAVRVGIGPVPWGANAGTVYADQVLVTDGTYGAVAPTATAPPTATATLPTLATATPTASPTLTLAPTSTATPAATWTPTIAASATPSPTVTPGSTPTVSSTSTAAPAPAPTASPTPANTSTATPTPTATVGATATATPTV